MSQYSSLHNSTSFVGDYIDVGEIITESLQLTAATNQLIMNNTTINDEEILPRVGTIPDTAGEDFQFVLTAANIDQTIGGVISFSDTIKVNNIEEYSTNNGVHINNTILYVDAISNNGGSGVTIESVNISSNTLYALNLVEPYTGTGINIANTTFRNGYFRCDSITEQTTNAGVNIEGMLIKDAIIYVDTIAEKTTSAGVTIDGVLLKDGLISDTAYTAGVLISDYNGVISSSSLMPGTITFTDIVASGSVKTDTIIEYSTGAGVNIDGVGLKDGLLTTAHSTGIIMSDLGVFYSTYTIQPTIYLNAILEANGAGVAIENITLQNGLIIASAYSTGILHANAIGVVTSSKVVYAEIDSQFESSGKCLMADGSSNASWNYPKMNLTGDNPPTGTNYITFSAASSGLSSLKTNSSLTLDYAGSVVTLYVPKIVTTNGVDKADSVNVSIISGVNTDMNIYFGSNSGYNTPRCSSIFTFNSFTNTLSVPYISSTVTLATDANNTYFNIPYDTGLTYALTCIASAANNYLPSYTSTITVNPFTSTITANLTGTASNANAVAANTNSGAISLKVLFAAAAGGAVYTSGTGLDYLPSSNVLSCNLTGNVTGALYGNADTATNSTYALIATSANTVTLADDTANATDYILFSNIATGERAIKTASSITCNPSAGLITATTFTGALSGNATTATTATVATTVTLANDTANSTDYLCFSNTATGDRAIKTNTGVTVNPSTATITATTFAGALNGSIESATTATTQTQTDISTKVATDAFANGVVPIGSVQMYVATTAPNSNWMVCDGSAISRTTYATLFALIGTTFGIGNGSTTFTLPDMRERMPYGYKSSTNNIAATGGAVNKTLATAELPAHTHGPGTLAQTLNVNHPWLTRSANGGITARTGPTTALYDSTSVTVNAMTGVSASTGSGTAFSILNPYLSLNFIIKVL